MEGRTVALLFWNPECSFCVRMTSRVKEWETDYSGDLPAVVFISSQPPERTFRMSLHSPIVSDPDGGLRAVFGIGGTPSAVLIDGSGKIASSVAVGSEMVLALAGLRKHATA